MSFTVPSNRNHSVILCTRIPRNAPWVAALPTNSGPALPTLPARQSPPNQPGVLTGARPALSPPRPRTHLQRRQVGVELREAVQHHGAALAGHLQPDAAPEAPRPPAALEHPLGAGGDMVRRGPAAAHHRRGRRIPGPATRRRPRQPPRLPGEPQRGRGGDGRGAARRGSPGGAVRSGAGAPAAAGQALGARSRPRAERAA